MDISLTPVEDRIETLTWGETERRHRQYQYETSDAAEDLLDAGVLSDTTTEQHAVQILADGEESAMVNFAVFSTDEVAYIQDVRVDEALRGNGVGTLLRQAVVDALEPRPIYSYPTNPTIKRIARDQGFREADALPGWYVRK